MTDYVAYYRVSTAKQGRSGLGIEAQRAAVVSYLNGSAPLAEYEEHESGKNNDRPRLADAMRHAKAKGATLVIAKLDRLARNMAFIANLMESGVDFVACDLPAANRFTLHVMAALAEQEATMISQRTKAALAMAKARGTKLGGDRGNLASVSAAGAAASLRVRQQKAARRRQELTPVVASLRACGKSSAREIATALNEGHYAAPRGGLWSRNQAATLLQRMEG